MFPAVLVGFGIGLMIYVLFLMIGWLVDCHDNKRGKYD